MTSGAVAPLGPSSSRVRIAADRWLYVAMAGLMLLIAMAAFVPTSTQLVASIASGEAPIPPLIVHVHAAAMVCWLMLLLAQTLLAAAGHVRIHTMLGLASLLLAPIMLIGMAGVILERFELVATLPPDMDAAAASSQAFRLTVINAGSVVLFPLFYVWAVLARRRDAQTHKRMIMLATVVLMSPAIGRMISVNPVLPDFGLNGADARHLYELLLLMPLLAHDVLRRGTVHRAYLIGLILILAYMTAAHLLWEMALP